MKKLLLLALLLFPTSAFAQASTVTCNSSLTQTAVLSSFADNVPGGITPRNLRDYVCSMTGAPATFGSTSNWPLSLYSFALDGSINVVAPAFNGSRGATTNALRTSDDTSGVSTNTNITLSSLIVVDNTSTAFSGWGNYWQGVKTSSATSAAMYNLESSVQNLSAVVSSDPYTPNPANASWNIRLDSGIGSGSPNNATAAIDILNNGARFESGIIFGSTALDVTSGTGEAIALAQNHALNWYSGAGTKSWQIYSNAASGNNSILLESGDLKISSGAQLLTLNTTEASSIVAASVVLSGGLGVAKQSFFGEGSFWPNNTAISFADSIGTTHSILFVSGVDETILKVGKSGGTLGLQNSGFVDEMVMTDTGNFTFAGTVRSNAGFNFNGTAGTSCSAGTISLATLAVSAGIITHC